MKKWLAGLLTALLLAVLTLPVVYVYSVPVFAVRTS